MQYEHNVKSPLTINLRLKFHPYPMAHLSIRIPTLAHASVNGKRRLSRTNSVNPKKMKNADTK